MTKKQNCVMADELQIEILNIHDNFINKFEMQIMEIMGGKIIFNLAFAEPFSYVFR